ncbi:MAG: oxidoreductase [Candidatus Melainabacteria bacterium GWF2_37_15]|nr:MAG: oxidoreductase [Candidatus Melainabacteria bacterium GWF2_37_15]
MQINFYQVDSFTDKPYYGNPAGVVVLDAQADESWMRKIAEEMNLSETAFVYPISANNYNLRWFTPVAEVDLCGHATLAAAHILWEKEFVKKSEQIRFQTKSGELICCNNDGLIQMDFPKEEASEISVPEELLKGVGVEVLYTGKNRMDYIVEVESEKIVKNLTPDINMLKKAGMRGVIVTSRSDNSEFDFVSRFFAPAVGIEEDPVTGSAHCCLAPYWAKKLNKNQFKALQLSKRQGVLYLELNNDRVKISGNAVTVFEGRILY